MRALIVTAAIALVACGPGPEPGTAVRTDTVHAADGVPIAYDVQGPEETALVFIHCWGCDRSFWRGQLEQFATDYRVVALDLAGHGGSGKDRADWTIPGLGGDVAAVVEALDLDPVILIGHSMGGPVALAAAHRMPDRVVGVVCVETLHDAEFDYSAESMEPFIRPLEADFTGAIEEFTRAAFGADVDPAVVDWTVARARSADPEVAIALIHAFQDLDLREMFAAVEVPIRCINAEPRPPVIPATEIERNRQYADFDAVLMEGVGHFPMLERPERFNTLLRDLLAELGARGADTAQTATD